MPVSPRAQDGSEQHAFEAQKLSIFTGLRVAMPGIIQSFDPSTVTCTVQPAIYGQKVGEDGSTGSEAIPILPDVPVVFPRGGGCTLTFPVKPGDECLLVFSDRCIDFWWQNGGVQEAVDPRQHDLSDAFAIVGPQSQAKKISSISTTAAQFRSDDGSTYFEINPTTKKIKLVAPGGFDVFSPESTFSAKVTITGLLTWMGGMVGSLASGTAAKITGAIEFFGTLKSNGKDISDQHTHSGVQSGNSNSGKVN
ncbi:TPA: Gp138 family membrane-puncturing spike protein [Enterobacter roggenkampii]|jgi:phage baseplate assembly protein gpV|uniref:Gp138 family membrane-puncturing spike protein n=1 Tax=Enterobacter roggenkampii TaxID=1812935 RepID=UPI003BE3DF31|nr:translation initiation factor IF-2 [Enterobacter roggenkampii]HCR1933095.1 translation initiation factor IF-2 [Enterobacter roggenkampii]